MEKVFKGFTSVKMCGLSPFAVLTMRILSCDGLIMPNPLSPKCDQHQISPCNISALENGAVMRTMDMITQILYPTSPHHYFRKRIRTTNENLNFDIQIERVNM